MSVARGLAGHHQPTDDHVGSGSRVGSRPGNEHLDHAFIRLVQTDQGRPKPSPRNRLRSGRSAGISDGNRDGNDGSGQRPEAAINSQLLSHV
jgi:hypothetical protein